MSPNSGARKKSYLHLVQVFAAAAPGIFTPRLRPHLAKENPPHFCEGFPSPNLGELGSFC